MSHFTHIETRFQNLFYLEKALNKLDIDYTRTKKITNVHNSKSHDIDINLQISQSNGYDIEFSWNGQEYELVDGEWDSDNSANEEESDQAGQAPGQGGSQEGLTQEQLAVLLDKKRTYISRVENNGSNLTLKTLFDIVEKGLGGKVNISIKI